MLGMSNDYEFTLTDNAESAATDRIAWAMLVASGEQSPRQEWTQNADHWRDRAEGVFRAALNAASSEAPSLDALTSDHKSFGPMHGERVPRHQFVIPADFHRETVVSTYQHTSASFYPCFRVELYGNGVEAADLTTDNAKALRDYLTEFIDAYEEVPDDTA
jgi:hypothetical protein